MPRIHISALVAIFATAIVLNFSGAAKADDKDIEVKTKQGKAATLVEAASATVKSIDPAARTVTVQTELGEEMTIQCGKAVRNFDQIKVGDVVKAAAIDRVALSLNKGGGPDEATAGQLVSRAPEGAKPGMLVADVEQKKATIEAIDTDKRTVTLKGEKGTSAPITVGPDVDLAAAKVGDEVSLTTTRGIALWVETPGAEAQPAGAGIAGPGAIVGVTKSLTVDSIDADKHTVTLKGPSGETETMQFGEKAVNFNQIKVGDKLHAIMAEPVALSIGKAGETADVAGDEKVALSPKGGKAGTVIAETEQLNGKIDSVDAAGGTLTVTVDGKPHKLKAGPKADLSSVKAGDEVSIRATEPLAIMIERPASGAE